MNDRELQQWINFLSHLRVDLRYLSAEAGGGSLSDYADMLHDAVGKEILSLRRVGVHVSAPDTAPDVIVS